ncbi:MAG: PEP-CTERM sorting domain-containing protein [Clostridiales bacterium]|nr:PEP-CTERM sorting domain-containing protein [Clostridiales bacterium]
MEPNTILALVLVALILAGLAFLYMRNKRKK